MGSVEENLEKLVAGLDCLKDKEPGDIECKQLLELVCQSLQIIKETQHILSKEIIVEGCEKAAFVLGVVAKAVPKGISLEHRE